MSSPSISKIHISQTTGLSLNERFTAIGTKPREAPKQQREPPAQQRSRSRSRSRGRYPADVAPIARAGAPRATVANRRLVQQLDRREKMQAALKLKRRSMKAIGGLPQIKRGSIRALRVAPGGRTVKANSLARVATMRADLIGYNNNNNNNNNNNINGNRFTRSRSFRRSSSLSGRLGARRSDLGGAAQRVAQRQQERGGGVRSGRSRSRSRARAGAPVLGAAPVAARRRSMSRGRAAAPLGVGAGAIRRGRSRSRSRLNTANAGARGSLPIMARLGVRPGGAPTGGVLSAGRKRSRSVTRRGVVAGRVQKRARNTAAATGQSRTGGGASNGVGRARGRLATAGGASRRSRSRTRKTGAMGQQLQQQLKQQRSGSANGGARRGRSSQGRGRGGKVQGQQRINGNSKKTNVNGQQQLKRKGQQQQQQQRNGPQKNGQQKKPQQAEQRRGRSRSRSRATGRPLGKQQQGSVKKEDLDQELDQYMATPNTDVDYLLKN